MRSRHNELIALLCWFHDRVEFVNSWVFGDLLIEEDVIGIEGKEIEWAEFKICGEFSVQVVEFEAGLEEFVIICSVVLMIACDHNDRDSCCSFAEHDKETLVVEAVISVEVISYIAIDHDAVDLLFAQHWGEEVIEWSVFTKVFLEVRPVSQHDQIKFHVCVGDVCQFQGNEVSRERDRIGAASVPPECVVVEGFPEIDCADFALVDEGLVIVYVFGEVEGGDAAIDFLKASPSDELDIGSIALWGSVKVDLQLLFRLFILRYLPVENSSTEGLTRLEGADKRDEE